jgi:DNA repair exonuclease SbcCD ATPase subunit
MDKAYNMDTYEASYREMNTLIDAEIRQYEQMIKLEKSKKDSDEDAIQDYEDSIADLKKQREELAQQRITDLGGFGSDNYRSDAEDFVSAWLDAFKETGDGLDELNDKWEEYMENLFIKQAAMKKAATLYSKAMGIIDDAIDKGLSGEDLGSYVDAARTAAQQASADLNDYLKALADVFGISQEGENTLSELQQGISDITESQAAAIEAYLNSIRFYVASQLSLISDLTATIREQYTTVLNPMLSVVKEIRSALTSFSDKLSRAFVQQGGAWKLQIC